MRNVVVGSSLSDGKSRFLRAALTSGAPALGRRALLAMAAMRRLGILACLNNILNYVVAVMKIVKKRTKGEKTSSIF